MQSLRSLLAKRVSKLTTLSAVVCLVLGISNTSWAQLEITELMISPIDGGAWEWLEVRNTTGADIDLDGYYADRLGDFDIGVTGNPNIQNTVAANTIIPANGVAIIYDGFLGSGNPATHDDSFFSYGLGPRPDGAADLRRFFSCSYQLGHSDRFLAESRCL